MALIDIEGIQLLNNVPLKQPSDVYIGDLLSCVMANIDHNSLWLTAQVNLNVIAIAHLHDLVGIVFVEGMLPSVEVIQKATECHISLFAYNGSAYHLACEIKDISLEHVL